MGVGAEELRDEVERLRSAIREHMARRGDDRCWLDDFKLYQALGAGAEVDTALPPRGEFLANCERYWERRQRPGEKRPEPLVPTGPGWYWVAWVVDGAVDVVRVEREVNGPAFVVKVGGTRYSLDWFEFLAGPIEPPWEARRWASVRAST